MRQILKFLTRCIWQEKEYIYDLFLPKVETLGILLADGRRGARNPSPEGRIFGDLINLPRLGQQGEHGSYS